MSLLVALTIKVSAILLLSLSGALLLRRSSAAARHWVLAVGVVSAGAVPALLLLPTPPVARMAPVGPLLLDALPQGPYLQLTEPVEPVDADGVGPVVASPPGGPRPGRSRSAAAAVASGDVIGRLAVTIWLAGAFSGLGVLLVGLARVRWLRASSSRVTDGPWHRLCADLSRSCGLNRGVDLLLGPRPGLVATWGWWRLVVMLPASASGWSAERMRVVLLHELAHARRGDWLLQLAAEALRCVWWFNPLAWMVGARLRRESEHAADDLVLARGVPAATCATHLVELAREVRKHRTWLPAPAMARPSNLERRVSAMLNPRTNRRPMTRFARFASLGVLAPISVVIAGLQVGPVSASRSAESTGSAVEPAPPAAPSSGRVTESVPVGAAATAAEERVQVGPVPVSRSAESIGNAVEPAPPAAPSSGRVTESVPVGAAAAAAEERVQVGPVPVSRSAESIGNAVEPAPPAAPSSGRVTELVPVAAAPGAVQERVQVGSVLRPAESTGSTVEQEQPVEPSSDRVTELVARATGHEQQQIVLDGQQALSGGSDRPTGRPEVGTGVRGSVVEEATIGPTGEMDDMEVARSILQLDEADEGRGAQSAQTPEADADGRSYEVLATTRASTLERELDATAAVSAPAPGEVFRDCDVCPEMVVLPEGDVALGRFEVTLEEYRVFAAAVPDVADTRCTIPRRRESWRAPGWLQTGRHPVACVSWRDAVAYVSWLSRETGHEYRLPTDSEWDRGAAGSPKGCNRFFTSPELGTCVVGSYPPSPAGIFGMLGNVSELTSNYWDGDRNRRVVRGPSWRTPDWLLGRPDNRRWVGTDRRNRWLGFRVARTLP